MAKAYSEDLRHRIVEAYQNGEGSMAQMAERFSVSKNFVNTLIQRFKSTQSIAIKPGRGKPKPKLDEHQREIVRQLATENSDATLEELCELTYEHTGVRVSLPTMCRKLKQMNLPRKKRHS